MQTFFGACYRIHNLGITRNTTRLTEENMEEFLCQHDLICTQHLARFLPVRNEFHRYGIHTVPGVLGSKALTRKYVAKMGIAIAAHNLYAAAIGIGQMLHRAG